MHGFDEADGWRLGYITLGVFLAACVTGPLAIVLLPVSFYFARATLRAAGGPEGLGSQRYLLYPSLFCTYAAAALAVLAVLPFVVARAVAWGIPVLMRLAAGPEGHYFYEELREVQDVGRSLVLAAAGGCWFFAGIFAARRAGWIFYPFGARCVRKMSIVVCVVGVGLAVLGVLCQLR